MISPKTTTTNKIPDHTPALKISPINWQPLSDKRVTTSRPGNILFIVFSFVILGKEKLKPCHARCLKWSVNLMVSTKFAYHCDENYQP